MTIEEAIKETCRKLQMLFSAANKSEEELVGIKNIPIEYLGLMIEVLEKQIPKKATDVRYFGEAGYYIGLCPCCNSGNNSEFQYCGDCGQAIDWKVEE